MPLSSLLAGLGPMRMMLLALALLCSPLVWLADSEPEGIGVLFAYVVPALVVILFFILMLDTLMNRVFMIEQDSDTVARHRLRLRADLLVAAVLVASWFGWFRDIGAL
ncbi:hypothetical protein [endosymbiont of unidentified scaly snail isolate Monju]|uniref:hypothetical protein n=1 Tax=endosymbiont of unidentified scaly snail isolate Monju TaxID=1248727 RepID=UPI0011DD6CB3|nr:hypothetical protein [endosymbiont of unidentified scaly snail isolate Monju]